MSSARIEAIGLSKSFSGPALFSDVSFTLEIGALAVVGPNGSGKTTLLKILAGLLRPSSGEVRIERDGRAVLAEGRRVAVGWAGPDLSFYPELTAEENLRFFARAAGRATPTDGESARLEAVGLERAAGPVERFSTGMKQRLRIAFATLLDPDVLLLDEPFAGLDAAGRDAVRRGVASAAGSGPVVLASTDLSDLPEVDQVLELSRNAAGTGPADLHPPQHEER